MLAKKRKENGKTAYGIKRLQTFSCFTSMFLAVMMTVSLLERAFLVKLFHESKENFSAAVCEFCRI